MRIFNKEISISELLISILSLLSGCFMVYWAIYFIYAYHFTSALWFEMTPMTTLIVRLILGTFFIVSACTLVVSKTINAFLYRLSGILIMLYPVNIIILNILDDNWYSQQLLHFAFLPIGLILYLFFNKKKYIDYNKNHNITLFIIGISIYFLIDIIFYNWTYF